MENGHSDSMYSDQNVQNAATANQFSTKTKTKNININIALDKIANVPIPFIRDGLSECVERTDILITLRLGL